MRFLAATPVLLCACGAHAPSGPPIRLSAGASDTVVVNSRHPTPLPVHVLDAAGRTVAGAPVRYAWLSGDSLPVTPTGDVTCTRSGDAAVGAASGRLTTRLLVRCRVVEYVRLPGPLQFVLGDSALSRPFPLPVAAYGADGRPVTLLTGSARVRDSSVATLRGLTLYPRARGITIAGTHFGDRDAAMGVHVYQRVGTLAALDTLLRVRPKQRLFAVPLRLERGEYRRQALPPGEWMLAMLPESDSTAERVRLRIDGARCTDHFLNAPRRWGCSAGPGASVTVYRPFGRVEVPAASGYLLVRQLF